jgi:hypothetical protein
MATEITAKGDLIVGTGSGTFDNLPAGTNGFTLVADSVETTGLKWVAPSSPSYTWTDFTPTIKQGTTTFTVSTDSGRFIIIGKLCVVQYRSTISSGTGQSNQEIELYVPAAAQMLGGNQPGLNGSIGLFDSSASTRYNGFFYGEQADYGYCVSGVNKATQNWGKTGSDFAIQLGVDDIIYGTITYRVA